MPVMRRIPLDLEFFFDVTLRLYCIVEFYNKEGGVHIPLEGS